MEWHNQSSPRKKNSSSRFLQAKSWLASSGTDKI
jgi:hypothetical protein